MNLPDDIQDLLDKPEGKQFEFKEDFPSRDAVAKTVIAFANQSGGFLIFGIKDEPRQVTGLEDTSVIQLEEQVTNHIYDRVAPVPSFESYTKSTDDGDSTLFIIEVFPGRQKPYRLKGTDDKEGVYLRVGSSNREADETILRDLQRQGEGISFDETPVGHKTLEDLDETLFKQFIERREQHRELPPVNFSESEHQKLDILTESAGGVYPTKGGFLLFNEHPADEFPQVTARCTRFKGTEMSGVIDAKEFDGSLIELPEKIVAFVKRHIDKGATIEGLYRKEQFEYPQASLREAIINAICHRDYSTRGSELKVAIFDDRIELTNPGGLPGRLSVEDLGRGISEIRNPVIANIFHQIGLIEQFGSGTKKIKNELNGWDDVTVEFEDTGTFFKAIFRKNAEPEERISAEDLSDEEKIVQYLTRRDSITARKAAELIGKTKRTAINKLKNLREQSKVKREGETPTDPSTVYVPAGEN